MAVSISILVLIASFHLMAFVLAIGAERRRSTATVVPDQYDELLLCVRLRRLHGVRTLGVWFVADLSDGLVTGRSKTMAIFFFIFSCTVDDLPLKVSFVGAEACLLAASAKNAYHTRYRAIYGADDLSCDTLRKGVFAGGAALTLLSMVASIVYYSIHSKADTGGWEKHQNEGVDMTSSSLPEKQDHGNAGSGSNVNSILVVNVRTNLSHTSSVTVDTITED
ncbi:hypothetical protein OSB04_018326 [Centaurea solstitialis]|uniref:CASP-like protein n=1 Tax=Centaurea solstitialis TaxID=347529 RepID=A0AA38THU6_9ASTR|nr:hypothetical protein OSB04_018326 [Centaurea solstitialis]